MVKFMDIFSNKICAMFLTESDTITTFDLSISLMQKIGQWCDLILKKRSKSDFRDIFMDVSNWTIEQLKANHSAIYGKKLERNDCYIAPNEQAVGTHWDMRKVKNRVETIPRLVQSKFHYIPISSTIKSLSANKEFTDMFYK